MADVVDRSGSHPQILGSLTRGDLLRRAGVGAAILGSSGLISACGSSGTHSSTPSSQAKRRGGALIVGISGGGASDTLDANNGALEHPDEARTIQLYDTLMTYTPAFQLERALAEELTPNSDASVWTLRLKQGVEFHNGKDLTVDDVIFTLQRILNPKNPKVGQASLNMVDPNGLTKLDPRTLRISLTSPYVGLDDALAQYYNGIVPVGYNPKTPIGTGAFKYKSFTPGQQSVFDRNPNYWRRGEPYVDSVTITDFPDQDAQVNALLSGQIHAMDSLPAVDVSSVRNRNDLAVLNSETGGWLPITMRVDTPPFNDVRVRQAFRLIIDRPRTLVQALSGYGRIGNDISSPFDPFYDHSLPQREQDIPMAKHLLAQAGQSNLSVTLTTTGSMAGGVLESALAFAAQAKSAGVSIDVRNLDADGFNAGYLKWPLAQSFWFTRNYLSQVAQDALPDSPYNETHWNNDRFTQLNTQARRTVDLGKRRELIHEMMTIEWNEGGYIIWGFNNEVDAYSSRLVGFEPDRSGIPLTSYGFRRVAFT
jgi:peptide/nickel transport system substrate-binding protein